MNKLLFSFNLKWEIKYLDVFLISFITLIIVIHER